MTVEIRNHTKAKFYTFVCKSQDSGIIYVDIWDKKPKDYPEVQIFKVKKQDYEQPTVYLIKTNKVVGIEETGPMISYQITGGE